MGRQLGSPVREPTSLDCLRGASLPRRRMSLAPVRVSLKQAKEFPNLARKGARGRPGILFTEACGACKLGPLAPIRMAGGPRARGARGSRARKLVFARSRARARNQCADPESAAYFPIPPWSWSRCSVASYVAHGSDHTKGDQNVHDPRPGPEREYTSRRRMEQEVGAEPTRMTRTGAERTESGDPVRVSPPEGE